jgi:hypothetical protein
VCCAGRQVADERGAASIEDLLALPLLPSASSLPPRLLHVIHEGDLVPKLLLLSPGATATDVHQRAWQGAGWEEGADGPGGGGGVGGEFVSGVGIGSFALCLQVLP